MNEQKPSSYIIIENPIRKAYAAMGTARPNDSTYVRRIAQAVRDDSEQTHRGIRNSLNKFSKSSS
jgi:hypothetical protein